MKKCIAVLGAGMVGRTIAMDLSTKFDVISLDISEANLQKLQQMGFEGQTLSCDLSDSTQYDTFANLADVFVCAVPGFMGFNVLKQIIPLGKHIVDISFFPEDARMLDALAKEHGVTVVTDAGVAPGLSNMMLGYCNAQFSIDSFVCYVGGLPCERFLPFQYKAPFSPVDVIEEYIRPARIKRNGKEIVLPALSETEQLHFKNIGTLEAFNSDGLRSLLHRFPHIPNMLEKTLRYPGHAAHIQFLKDAGFFSSELCMINGISVRPIDVATQILTSQWKLNENETEFTVMQIDVYGTQNNRPVHAQLYVYDETDTLKHQSSMSRTTGFTCTATLQALLSNRFSNGLIFPEEVAAVDGVFDYVLAYLKDRNVGVEMNINVSAI
jgi:saccharopine dehydrogenase-like NADP-dependent oxidoreductase